jgi:hypothetical protein
MYIYTYITYINGIKLVIFQQAMICNWLKLTNHEPNGGFSNGPMELITGEEENLVEANYIKRGN